MSGVQVINISLIHHGSSSDADTKLGVVTIPFDLWPELRLPELRQILKQQLSQVLPERFIFCSTTRHTIQYVQEQNIRATQICDSSGTVLIRSNYDIPRLLVRNSCSVLGHLCIAFVSSLADLRDLIYSNCPGVPGQKPNFRFLYSDGSPVSPEREEETPVHEVLQGFQVFIDWNEATLTEPEYPSLQLKRKSLLGVDNARAKSLRMSFSSSKDVVRQSSHESTTSCHVISETKQLLISYVRAEAAEHALSLKRKLTEKGFSVYLDIHEIKSGIDWQDSLNYAVSNCEVFIPLVTPRYGETQWTNREVKLADVLGKPILPINFLDEWPPRCLAIQFATTQFVKWKPLDQITQEIVSSRDESKNIRLWEPQYVEKVAQEIELRIKSLKSGFTSKPALTRMKTLMKTFAGRLPASATPLFSNHDSEEPAGPQIVVIVHPNEANYGNQMKSWLEEVGHTVWVSGTRERYPSIVDRITASQESMDVSELKSDNMSHSSGFLNVSAEQISEFQNCVDKASVIIIVLSKAFTVSKICRQQVFYCEHRKQILPVIYEEFRVPCWLKMLIRAKKLMNINKPCFYKILLSQIKRALDPTAKTCLESDNLEANINLAVQYLKKTLDVRYCVYVSGASKILEDSTQAVCRSIGEHLAKLRTISVVTGGSYGASELVARTYHQQSSRQSAVWHVLPEQDSQDMSERYNQTSDGTFTLRDFGQTLFCGQNMWEKETIVGRCFPVYLLIEGGLDVVHEVEEFVWSDHVIVPVFCSPEIGESSVTEKMFQLPPGVSERDWACLMDRTTPPEVVGRAVASIISDLLGHLHQQMGSPAKTPTHNGSFPLTPDMFEDKQFQKFMSSQDTQPVSDLEN